MEDLILTTKGISVLNQKGEEIPKEISRLDRIRKTQDKIEILERSTAGGAEYFIYVNEEPDSGGGRMGEALDALAKEENKKEFPSIGYDKVREADVYKITFSQLCRVWDIYLGKVKATEQITEAQRRARQANMDTALRARAEKREQSRKKRLKGTR